MLDYRAWIGRLQEFIGNAPRLRGKVEHEFTTTPTLTKKKIDQLDKGLRLKIPRPIAAFLEQGAGGCFSHYFWTPEEPEASTLGDILDRRDIFGGVPLCDSEKLAEWQEWCLEGANETWIADEPEDRAYWLRCFPFAFMSDGNFLALDSSDAGDDPPVVFLCHDEESFTVSPSFDAFLFEWQRLCYIGPDNYWFKSFLDPATNYLTGGSEKGQRLRQLFGTRE